MVYLTCNPRRKATYVGTRSRGKAPAQPITVDTSALWHRADVGMLITPWAGDRSGPLRAWPCQWGADTGNFKRPVATANYLAWLADHLPFVDRCLFATAPDVVGNWAETWQLSKDVLPEVRALGYPAAVVAQDGMTELPDPDLWDVLFVGGTTDFKLSETAYGLVSDAKALGRWCHMGRVNSWRRIKAAAISGYDSADGTCLRFNPPQYVREIALWLDTLRAQPSLDWSAA